VSLPEALEQTGFDRTQKSAFIWEGVTMYLAAAALAATLADVARLSAPHSILMTTYVTHRLSARYAALGRAAVASLALVSEPMRSFMSPSEMASLQERHGFVLRSDVRPSDATDRFGIESHARFAAHPDERLVVTERRPH
jgi:methyltransferase (TIGR00027 family)